MRTRGSLACVPRSLLFPVAVGSEQREDGAGELLTRQQHSGILRRPFQPPPAAACLLLLLVSPSWELAGERVFGVGDV